VKQNWIGYLKNPLVALVFTVIISTILLHFFTEFGKILLIILVAFFASDMVSLLFIRGGNGILQIPIMGTEAQSKGYGYLAFYFVIIISAIASGAIAELILNIFISPKLGNLLNELIISSLFSVAVYLDLKLKFYDNRG
jgi:hypothetical protein